MKQTIAIAVAVMLAAGPASAAWTYKPAQTARTVEQGVAVYRGPATPAVALDALDTSLAGGEAVRTIRVRVSVDPVRRYPARRLVHHGFVDGARRYHRSHGPVPGRVFAEGYDSYPGRY